MHNYKPREFKKKRISHLFFTFFQWILKIKDEKQKQKKFEIGVKSIYCDPIGL